MRRMKDKYRQDTPNKDEKSGFVYVEEDVPLTLRDMKRALERLIDKLTKEDIEKYFTVLDGGYLIPWGRVEPGIEPGIDGHDLYFIVPSRKIRVTTPPFYISQYLDSQFDIKLPKTYHRPINIEKLEEEEE